MGGFAKVTLIGNLGKDPEVKFTGGGTAVANLRVACTDRAKNKEGVWEDRTEWVSVVSFGKQAEAVGQHLSKGSQIYVEGRLQTREWNDKDGNKRYSTEVVANDLLFLGGKRNEAAKGAPAQGSSAPPDDDRIPF